MNSWNEKEFKQLRNLRDSVNAIKKMTKEIEHHPENENLLKGVVEYISKERSITDFKKVFLTREEINENEDYLFKDKFLLREKIKVRKEGNCFYFGFDRSGDGTICLDRCDELYKALDFSEKRDQRYQKFVGMNDKDELILFIVDRNIIITEEQKKVLKNFLEK